MASGTLSNPESHSYLSLVDFITVTFNMAVTVKIVVLAVCHVELTVNGARSAALGAIEGEIPTTTAVVPSRTRLRLGVVCFASVCTHMFKHSIVIVIV